MTGEVSLDKVKEIGPSDQSKPVMAVNTDLVAMRQGDASQGNYHPYPKPLAKYQDVVADSELFIDTLEKLHAAMGTKFIYLHPDMDLFYQGFLQLGGRELDLHRLFVEVTSRGGIEKVIQDRRWREVTAVFNFPSTATNASFVLRKYYMSLIYHYEQIYYFESQASVAGASGTSVPLKKSGPVVADIDSQFVAKKRRRSGDESVPSGFSLATNSPVVGVINGKCEHGYFVTVTVGTTRLKGILYHPAEQNAVHSAQLPASNDTSRLCRRRRRRKKLSKRDPTHPKPNRSGYNFFFSEQHARLKPLHPGKDREISKMIGELWNNLLEADKAVYQDRGMKDKERYQSEMEVYRQKMRTDQIVSNAVPIQQRPEKPDLTTREAESKLDVDEDYLEESSTGSSELDDKNSDTDSEEELQEMAATAPESVSPPADLSNEVGTFELRRREDNTVKNDNDLPSSSEDVESKKAVVLTDKA